MLIYPFGGYEGFKEIFELREHGNGVKSRRNLILLSLFKSRKFLQYVKETDKQHLLGITSMSELWNVCLNEMTSTLYSLNMSLNMCLKGRYWSSSLYRTDHMKGKTEDGDSRSIRYVRIDNGKVYKMKAGKMYRHLILESHFGQVLPEQVVNWLCEELVLEWSGYNTQSQYELHVDDNFKDIYASYKQIGDFGSCMNNRDRDGFYRNAVESKAAYLTNADDKIVARAIIFTNVLDDETGQTFRLCERQYSSDCDNMLKQILVNKLIEGGYIDGYKRIGADCHSPEAFVDINGHSLSGRSFSIHCDLDYGDTISYQDSFKWYVMRKHRAYNYEPDDSWEELATTDSVLGGGNYDEYHDCYTQNEVVTVYHYGREITCDEDRLHDFTYINGEYHHDDDISVCDECGECYVSEYGYTSNIDDACFCCRSCRDAYDQEYCEDNPDEYAWIDGEAVSVDDIFECPHCHEKQVRYWCSFRTRKSKVTGEEYCCEECRQAAEQEYLKNNESIEYALCSECQQVCKVSDMIESENGSLVCQECHNVEIFLQTINKKSYETV